MFRVVGRVVAFVPLVGLLLAGTACSGSDGGGGTTKNLPDATATLKQASQAMTGLKSVGIRLSTADDPKLLVRGGDMKLLRDGDAEGTIQIAQSGQRVEMKLVVVGEDFHMKGVTGGWRKLPRAMAATMYDPSAVLDPQRGISTLLTSLKDPKAEATEDVAGKKAHRIAATLPKDAVGGLIPGIGQDVKGKLWIAADTHRLLRVRGELPGEKGGTGTVTVDFTEFDAPYKIAAPA